MGGQGNTRCSATSKLTSLQSTTNTKTPTIKLLWKIPWNANVCLERDYQTIEYSYKFLVFFFQTFTQSLLCTKNLAYSILITLGAGEQILRCIKLAKVAWIINNRNGIQLLWQVVDVSASPAGLLADELDVALVPQAERKADTNVNTAQCNENYHREVDTVVPELRAGND